MMIRAEVLGFGNVEVIGDLGKSGFRGAVGPDRLAVEEERPCHVRCTGFHGADQIGQA